MSNAVVRLLPILCATVWLAACGGGGGEDSADSDTSPTPVSAFTQQATWTVALPAAGSSVCYDFNARAEVSGCSGTAWDLKLTVGSRGSVSLWTNSGTSGTGAGGAFGGPFDHTWSALQTYTDATTLPATVFRADGASGVFSGSNSIQSAAFEYGVGGANDHRLYPNFRVFLITTNAASADAVGTETSPVFALQITGYYGGTGGTTSGYPSFRWVDRRAPTTVREATVDARAGWVYFDLVQGAVSSEAGTWHIAFNRYNVKLNGGSSGSGTVAGFVGRTPAGFYDANGAPVAAKFQSATLADDTLPDLQASDLSAPASASAWVRDALASALNPASRGSYPNALDYGWYVYHPTAASAQAAGLPAVAHLLQAQPERGSLLRGGEGNTFARMRLRSIAYADPNNASSAQTWTFDFEVQPAR
ncbi:HmuY family protein [Caldimonas sp.]|uniref:HmuY family protein n=1 Tax=Caldimonas sp. TaxID=2838790 RepID=UPI00391A3565